MTRTRIAILITLVAIASAIPITLDSEFQNYNVKQRPVGQKVLSKSVDSIEVLRERAYYKVAQYREYVLEAGKLYAIPPNVLLAILYEEELHRKPVDLSTYGPAQLGLGELQQQGLPPRVDLLEDPEVSVYILAAKLKRLQVHTKSLQTAIILHNGYSDYLNQIQRRARDPRILEILTTQYLTPTYEA
jgi:hypothetical protein